MKEKEIEKLKEDFLDAEVSEVFVVQNSKKRAYIEQFKKQGINFTQKKLGTFLGFFIVRDSSSSSANIVNFLTAEIKKEYFAFPKRGVAESFETSLHRVNRALAEVANVGNVDWLGTIDGAVCAIDEKTMYFSVTGEAAVLLLRGDKLMNISESLTSEEAKQHPLKTFVDISSGQLMTGDKIIVTSPELIQLISFDELKRNALRLSRNNFVQFINTVFANECKMATAFVIDINKKANFSVQENLENEIYDENEDEEIHIPNNVFTAQVFPKKREEEIKENEYLENSNSLEITKNEEFNSEREAEINGEYTDKRTGHIYLQGDNVENVSGTWSSISDVLKDTTRDIKEGTKKTLRKLAKKLNKNSDFEENNYQNYEKSSLQIESEIDQLKQEIDFENESQPIKIKVAKDEKEQELNKKETTDFLEDYSSSNYNDSNFKSSLNSSTDSNSSREGISDFGDDEVYFREDSKLQNNNVQKKAQDIEYFKPELEKNNLENLEFSNNAKNGLKIKVRSEDYQENNSSNLAKEEVKDFEPNFDYPENEFKRGQNNSNYSARIYSNNFNKFKNENKRKEFLREDVFEEDLENDFRNDLLKRGSFDSLNQGNQGFFKNMLNMLLSFFAKIFQFIFFVLDTIIITFQRMSGKNKILTLTLIIVCLAVSLFFFYKKSDNSNQQVSNQNNNLVSTNSVSKPVQVQPVAPQPTQPQIKATINEPEKIYEDKDFVFVEKMQKEEILLTKNSLVTLSDKSKYSLPTNSGNIKYFATSDDTNSIYFVTENNKMFSFNLKTKKFEEKKLDDNKNIKDIKAMSIFGKYLYILSDNEGIMKYTQNESGFANGTKWLKENYITKSITDMAINSSIYLVKNGKIEVLFSGKKKDFKLENDQKIDLVYAKDTKALWVLNKKEATIYQFDLETGKVSDQFTHDNIKDAIDFSVDESSRTALVTTSNKVLKFKLEKK